MAIVKLANYSNGGFTFINTDHILFFSEVSYNGNSGTELALTGGRTFITSYYPEKVRDAINEVNVCQ